MEKTYIIKLEVNPDIDIDYKQLVKQLLEADENIYEVSVNDV